MQPNLPPISIVRGHTSSFFYPLGAISNPQVYTMTTDPFLLNSLLASPMFWAAIRKFVGLSQEQLAAAIGVSRQTVSRWENDRAAPTRARTIKAQSVLEEHLRQTVGRMKEKLEGEFQEAATT